MCYNHKIKKISKLIKYKLIKIKVIVLRMSKKYSNFK
jgi:hypothetical protein